MADFAEMLIKKMFLDATEEEWQEIKNDAIEGAQKKGHLTRKKAAKIVEEVVGALKKWVTGEYSDAQFKRVTRKIEKKYGVNFMDFVGES